MLIGLGLNVIALVLMASATGVAARRSRAARADPSRALALMSRRGGLRDPTTIILLGWIVMALGVLLVVLGAL